MDFILSPTFCVDRSSGRALASLIISIALGRSTPNCMRLSTMRSTLYPLLIKPTAYSYSWRSRCPSSCSAKVPPPIEDEYCDVYQRVLPIAACRIQQRNSYRFGEVDQALVQFHAQDCP